MEGLIFETQAPPAHSHPARADIACFVGFVAARTTGAALRARLEDALRDLGWDGPPLPDDARIVPPSVVPSGTTSSAFDRWVSGRGWTARPSAVAPLDLFRRVAARLRGAALADWWVEHAWLSPASGRSVADLLELADVPVPIHTWDAFDALFAWDARPLVAGTRRVADTTLGAAVRRFFLHGGRTCYVVRAGDPWPPLAERSDRPSVGSLLSDVAHQGPADRSTWRGVGHLLGLPDVSFLCVPDLPDLCASDARRVAPEMAPEVEERFIECAARVRPAHSRTLRAFPAPRCDTVGFDTWAAFVARVGRFLERRCREVQYVAAVPLPIDDAGVRARPVSDGGRPVDRPEAVAGRAFAARETQWEAAASIQTAFVQLVYPWLRTRESVRLPGALEAPDALLVGLLAANAIARGTWRSVAREPLPGLAGLEPVLSNADRARPRRFQGEAARHRVPRALRERVSLVAPATAGFRLLSDVTTDDDEAYRPASVNRLVASIVRAARLAGEQAVFANSGEALWQRLRSGLEAWLLGLWGDGALAGATPAEAFEVRCDRSTMTPADLEAGRAIVQVRFIAASPIERITVVLAMDEGGQVTLVPPREALGMPA